MNARAELDAQLAELAEREAEGPDPLATLIETLALVARSVDGLAKQFDRLEVKVEALDQLFASWRVGAE
jgi:hypothetical protein